MTRIESCFQALGKKGKKAFVAYITAGDPSWQKTVDIIKALEAAGTDLLELGVPFSDPMADGPAIQMAMDRALVSKTSLRSVIDGMEALRKTCSLPVLLFTYYNPVHQMGLKSFVQAAKRAGADGALVTDLTPESAGEYKAAMDAKGLNTVFLTAPTTPPDRIKKIASMCSGFVYHISRAGVTGVRDRLAQGLAEQVQAIKEQTNLPVAVGFGVSKPEHVQQVAQTADGVVVGSAIVRKIEETNGDAKAVEKLVKELVAPLK